MDIVTPSRWSNLSLPVSRPRGWQGIRFFAWIGIFCGLGWRLWELWNHRPISIATAAAPLLWKQDLLPTVPTLYTAFVHLVEIATKGAASRVLLVAFGLSLATLWPWYRFFRELLSTKTLALLTTALVSLLPSWVGLSAELTEKTLLLPIVGAALALTWRALRHPHFSPAFFAVGAWALAGCIDPRLLILALSTAVALACVQSGVSRWRRWFLPAVTATGLCVMAWLTSLGHILYLNAHYALSRCERLIVEGTAPSGEYRLAAFESPSASGRPLEPLSSWRPNRAGTLVVSSEDRVDLPNSASARPWSALQVGGDNLVFFAFGRVSRDEDEGGSATARVADALRWIWLPLTILVVLALGRAAFSGERVAKRLALLLLGWILVAVIPCGLTGSADRLPYEAILLAGAVLAFVRTRSSRDARG